MALAKVKTEAEVTHRIRMHFYPISIALGSLRIISYIRLIVVFDYFTRGVIGVFVVSGS